MNDPSFLSLLNWGVFYICVLPLAAAYVEAMVMFLQEITDLTKAIIDKLEERE